MRPHRYLLGRRADADLLNRGTQPPPTHGRSRTACRLPSCRAWHCAFFCPMAHAPCASEANTLRKPDLLDTCELATCALFVPAHWSGCRTRKRGSFHGVAAVDGARSSRGPEEGFVQFDYARHDPGAPLPARLTAHARELRLSPPRACARPARISDPSASHVRTLSRIIQPLTGCAPSTPCQASIRRASPRTATQIFRAAPRRRPLFRHRFGGC